ncbi:C1 family peptidase [Mesorhizobium sp.]|uniref:C1 family peptidase n=1 Tax=Mesorhizobium sp. TaxID=1871066 RepID=UPI0025E840AF|nr:C1 family peptidase [Mesorhizobium sp.]
MCVANLTTLRSLTVLFLTAGWLCPLATTAQTQTLTDNSREHATGLIFEDPSTYKTFPASPGYRAFIPESVDMTKRMPPVGDQGRQGSCVAWAVGYAARSYYASATESRDLSQKSNLVSPAYIYDTSRKDPYNCDEGTSVSTALDLLKTGAVSHSAYPYDDNRCGRPPDIVAKKATDFRIMYWFTIDVSKPDQIKAQLYMGHPVVVSLHTAESLDKFRGKSVYRNTSPAKAGGHAITVVGYDERRQAFRAINSWGKNWGDKGFAWIAYETIKQDGKEAYAMRLSKAPVSPVEAVPVPEPRPVPPIPKPTITPPQPDIVEVLPKVTCGKIDAAEYGSTKTLAGFVGDEKEFQQVRAYAKRHHASFDVQHYPWPQCEAAMILSEAQQTDTPLITGEKKRALAEGEVLRIGVRTPKKDSFLHLAYIQADGKVVNLTPPEMALRQYPAHTSILLGDGTEGGPTFRVKQPFGNEMIIAVTSKSPLFPDTRPQIETEREFLTALKRAVLYGRSGEGGGRNIGATYQLIETRAKGSE